MRCFCLHRPTRDNNLEIWQLPLPQACNNGRLSEILNGFQTDDSSSGNVTARASLKPSRLVARDLVL